MAGWDDQIFANLPGSPRRPKPPPDQRSLMQTMFPVDPREVIGGLMNQATEGAGNLAAGAARLVGLPNPDLLGHDVTGFLQSPTFGGGASPMAGATTLAAAPLGARALRGARTAEEIATGVRGAATESDAATQAARAAQASPGQAALDRRMSGQAAAPTPSATEIATGGGRALTDIAPDIRNMPVDQGIKQAQTEAHLVPVKGGGYVGAPPDIQTYADLQARRGQVDDYIAQHLGGADWYDRARGGINQATGGDPTANTWLSKLQGSLSAGVSPESETAFAIKEAVSRAAGDPQVAHWGAQSRAIDRAVEANDPSLMQFGDKTEEYAAKIDPNQPPFKNATGVNDFRQLKLWGYPGRAEGVDPSAGETQHRFLDYETALTADRANQRQLGGRTDWTGEQIQAVPWVTQKAEDLGIPFEQAAMAGADYYPKHAAAATYEQQPGQALVDRGHLPGASGMSADQRAAFAANDPWTDPSGRDVIYGGGRVVNSSGEKTGLGVPTLPTVSATGVWKDETNPARIAQPTVPFNISTKANPAIGGAPLGTKDIPPYAQDFLTAGEMIRSTFGAQEAGGAHKLWEKQAPGAQNAVFVPLDRDATRPEIDALSAAGEPFGMPHVTSTNGGLAVLNFDGAPKLSTQDRNGLLDAINNAKPDDAGGHRMVRANTVSAAPNYTTPGAFTATQSMLDAVGDNPFFTQNAGIGQAAGALARRDEAWGPQIGEQGQDFWNLRQLAAADPGPDGLTWADRLKNAVQRRAVPASVTVGGSTVALYPTAGLPATPQQQPQQTPGMSLNSPPDWMRQYWNGGL
jgi:hypothetical protein